MQNLDLEKRLGQIEAERGRIDSDVRDSVEFMMRRLKRRDLSDPAFQRFLIGFRDWCILEGREIEVMDMLKKGNEPLETVKGNEGRSALKEVTQPGFIGLRRTGWAPDLT